MKLIRFAVLASLAMGMQFAAHASSNAECPMMKKMRLEQEAHASALRHEQIVFGNATVQSTKTPAVVHGVGSTR